MAEVDHGREGGTWNRLADNQPLWIVILQPLISRRYLLGLIVQPDSTEEPSLMSCYPVSNTIRLINPADSVSHSTMASPCLSWLYLWQAGASSLDSCSVSSPSRQLC